MRRLLAGVALAGVALAGAGWVLTAPDPVPEELLAGLSGDAARGEAVFTAAGCASCHHAPDSEDRLVLAGGQSFPSDFGTFRAPNISPDPDHGIGGWSFAQFANAVTRGISPEGQHLYPAFPYTAYAQMAPQDLADLWAYMATLPADATPNQPHDLPFPFSLRRGVGVWKLLYADRGFVLPDPGTPDLTRGRYLAEALAHCGECHSPRTALGGLDRSAWLTGAPDPSGRGTIPGLTPDQLDWSAEDIAYYLESGFTPDYDSAGGHMVEVITNFAALPAEDRAAVAAYLKALPEGGRLD
ncbi:cytochrome c [Salipiger marinus]|uniref:Cytochrome c, mono-and diheme variants n=1 Tax=Salipiger marinus TaxID=555512 RepID=A0A1G8TS21_9RHOB|nr:cytochrome c [Salipiger marinus]SDI93626.1 Cytochrome c, mono-and diheme variants [Salipiger marinus]SDJ43725.1 Cytochrome c, mono-and diheme variants [Salipiger marinus]